MVCSSRFLLWNPAGLCFWQRKWNQAIWDQRQSQCLWNAVATEPIMVTSCPEGVCKNLTHKLWNPLCGEGLFRYFLAWEYRGKRGGAISRALQRPVIRLCWLPSFTLTLHTGLAPLADYSNLLDLLETSLTETVWSGQKLTSDFKMVKLWPRLVLPSHAGLWNKRSPGCFPRNPKLSQNPGKEEVIA